MEKQNIELLDFTEYKNIKERCLCSVEERNLFDGYIMGIVDGEGCFVIRSNVPELVISICNDIGREIILKIRKYLGFGKIYCYDVTNMIGKKKYKNKVFKISFNSIMDVVKINEIIKLYKDSILSKKHEYYLWDKAIDSFLQKREKGYEYIKKYEFYKQELKKYRNSKKTLII